MSRRELVVVDNTEAVLVLGNFQRPVFVDFGQVYIGHRVRRRLRLECTKKALVTLEKCPPSFTVQPTRITVTQRAWLEILWTVEEGRGEVRDVVGLKLNDKFRLHVTLLGDIVAPKPRAPPPRSPLVVKNVLTVARIEKPWRRPGETYDETALREWMESVLVGPVSGIFDAQRSARAAFERLAQTRARIELEIRSDRLAMRDDRDTTDVGLRSQLIELLTNTFSAPWLRLCARQFGAVPKEGHASTNQLLRRVLFGEVRVAGGRDGGAFGSKTKLRAKRQCIAAFLGLVHLLEEARLSNALPHRPKLFLVQDGSKVALREFAALCLAREGDIVPHLAKLGLLLRVRQSPLDEVDWRIRQDLQHELRDGIKLARAVECLLGDVLHIRAPASTRTHKLHNVHAAIAALERHNVLSAPIPDHVCRSIVDAKRDDGCFLVHMLYLKYGGAFRLASYANTLNAERVRLSTYPSAWTNWVKRAEPHLDADLIVTKSRMACQRAAAVNTAHDAHPTLPQALIDSWRTALSAGLGDDTSAKIIEFYRPPELRAGDPLLGDEDEDVVIDDPRVAARLVDLDKLRRAIVQLQRSSRCSGRKRRHNAALLLQAVARCFMDRCRLWFTAAALHIQTAWRLRRHLWCDSLASPARCYSARRSKRDIASLDVCALDAKLLWATACVAVLLRSIAKRLLDPKVVTRASQIAAEVPALMPRALLYTLVDSEDHDLAAVLTIQASARRYLAYLTVSQVREAASIASLVRLQAAVRCRLAIVKIQSDRATAAAAFTELRRQVVTDLALSLQCMARRRRSTARARRLRLARDTIALRLQSCARRHQSALTVHIRRTSATRLALWLQSHWRRHKTVKANIRRHAASRLALWLQSHARRRREAAAAHAARRTASGITVFQSHVRRRIARTRTQCLYKELIRASLRLQSLARRRLAVTLLVQRRAAATDIALWVQSHARRRNAINRAHIVRRLLVLIAVRLQSVVRRRLAQTQYIRRRAAAAKVALGVQRHLRRRNAINRARLLHRVLVLIAMHLQALVRRHLALKHVVRRRAAAAQIAIWVQCHVRGRQAAKRYQRHRSVIAKLQSLLRRHLAAEHVRRRRAAASDIAHWIRSHFRRRKAVTRSHLVRRARTTIMSRLLMVVTRRRVIQAAVRQRAAALQISLWVQSHARRRQAVEHTRLCRKELTIVTLKLQSMARRLLAVLHVARRRAGAVHIALWVQSHTRRWHGVLRHGIRRNTLMTVALRMQSLARRHLAAAELDRRRAAAAIIALWVQSHARRRRARARTHRVYSAHMELAFRVQALARRRLAARHVSVRRTTAAHIALWVQTHSRCRHARLRVHLLRQALLRIALGLQSHARRTFAAERMASRHAAAERIALWVQKHVRRGHALSCQARLQSRTYQRAYLTVSPQPHNVARQHGQSVSRDKLTTMVVLLQSHARRRRTMRQSRALPGAVCLLQALVRRRSAVEFVTTRRAAANQVALWLHSHARRRRAAKYAQSLHYAVEKIAVRMQAHARRRQARDEWQFRLCIMTTIAIWVQRHTRRWLAHVAVSQLSRHRARLDKVAVWVQSCVRRRYASAIAIERRSALTKIAVFLQSYARRRASIATIRRARVLAVLLQRLFRRIEKQVKAGAVLKLQAKTRQMSARRTMARILGACITLQAAARGHTARRRRRCARRAIVALQSTARGFISRLRFRRGVALVVRLQAVTRRLIQMWRRGGKTARPFPSNKLRLAASHAAATVVQSIVRGRAVRRKYHRDRSVCACTQRALNECVNMVRADRFLRALHADAVVILQRWWLKVRRENRGLGEEEESSLPALRIQCAWRRHKACWTFYLRLGAIVTIQRLARGRRRTWRTVHQEGSPMGSLRRVARAWVRDSRLERARATIARALRCSRPFAAIRKRRFQASVATIQAAARSLVVRQRTREMAATRRRLLALAAEARAEPERVVGNRTRAALAALRTSTKLTEIMKACCELETSTRLSVLCCECFAAARAPAVLYRLMRTCNRSKPHLELLGAALRVLANITAHDYLCPKVCHSNAHADVILTLLQILREHEDPFSLALTILRRACAFVASMRAYCNTADNVKRLTTIANLLKLRGHTNRGLAISSLIRANALGCARTNVSRG